MLIRSQHWQVVPSKKVGLKDHTVRLFAKRLEKVGGVGRSNKQEEKSMWQQTSTFNFGQLQVEVGHMTLPEKLSPGGTGTTRRSGLNAVGHLPPNKVFF